MSLRIGCDLDGVLADMESVLDLQAVALFGEAILHRRQDDATSASSLQLSSRQERRLWRHIATLDNFWETLEECEPGVVARLASIAVDRRWEIIFLTKRPETAGATAQVQTQRWLASKGFPLPSVFVVQGSRGRIAESLALDIVIDDRPENCLDVAVDSTARAVLLWRADRALIPAATRRLDLGVVTTVNECLDVLTTLDEAPSHRAGILDRLIGLLGLKEPTLDRSRKPASLESHFDDGR